MDPMNPGMPGGVMPPPPASPVGGPPPSPMGGPMGGPGDDPHNKIMEALRRIEDKLAAIAVKVGV